MTEPKTENRVRLSSSWVKPKTKEQLEQMNAAGVGRSQGAVIDIAVDDLSKKVAKQKGKA
jgi:hypothetical protein